MKKILILITLFVGKLNAQISSTESSLEKGIQWTTGLTWEQVQAKARRENKYIFIDAYTTWCGPCKLMDKDVYVSDTVGAYFKDKFISVKVQMDKKESDAAVIQKWYTDAEKIAKRYHVRSYPTLIFLSPDGTVTSKITGYKKPLEFLQEAKKSLRPGQKYMEVDQDFYDMLADFDAGLRDYTKMPWMVRKAKVLGGRNFITVFNRVAPVYYNYILEQPIEKWMEKDNLEFFAIYNLNSLSPVFKLFTRKEKEIDKIVGLYGFAADAIVRVIQNELVEPVLGIDKKTFISSRPESTEADWIKLGQLIKDNYPNKFVKRSLTEARLLWYDKKANTVAFEKTWFQALDEYGVSTDDKSYLSPFEINHRSWFFFNSETDSKILMPLIRAMKTVTERVRDNEITYITYADTYANLLYKIGKIAEGIALQENLVEMLKAKQISERDSKQFVDRLELMKKGLPTWRR